MAATIGRRSRCGFTNSLSAAGQRVEVHCLVLCRTFGSGKPKCQASLDCLEAGVWGVVDDLPFVFFLCY